MRDDLAVFLADRDPGIVDEVVWGSRMRFRVAAYLSDDMPPLRYVTSARAVVMRGERVLVAEDSDGRRHILPGGRLEASELPEVALHREILEETGWRIGSVRQLGVLHFRHLTPKPPDYRYPYPSFIQVIYRAEASRYGPGHIVDDDYVVSTELVPMPRLRAIALTLAERMFLDAAIGNHDAGMPEIGQLP